MATCDMRGVGVCQEAYSAVGADRGGRAPSDLLSRSILTSGNRLNGRFRFHDSVIENGRCAC
jgi:hypothetical protein